MQANERADERVAQASKVKPRLSLFQMIYLPSCLRFSFNPGALKRSLKLERGREANRARGNKTYYQNTRTRTQTHAATRIDTQKDKRFCHLNDREDDFVIQVNLRSFV